MDRAGSAALALPPRISIGPLGWLRANLFSTWYNVILTVLILWVLASVLLPLARWMVFDATWATTSEACRQARQLAQASGTSPAACWAVILANLRLFLIGTYPPQEAHRVLAALVILGALGALTAFRRTRGKALALGWGLSLPAIIASSPLGVSLALGRRSGLPVVRLLWSHGATGTR
ncbi:MAG: hypothetical protein ACE5JD_12750 [Candidatus Methylomirabilia bacterium]